MHNTSTHSLNRRFSNLPQNRAAGLWHTKSWTQPLGRQKLNFVIRPWPGQLQDADLIAESAPRLLRMAQSIDERRRAEALIVIADALPN
jgi:hypothetical protein